MRYFNYIVCILVVIDFFIQDSSSSAIINRYDDNDCSLFINKTVIDEIKVYKNTTTFIMDGVKKYSSEMYEEYSKFIDKFGARPSGSENLEDAINYIIQMTISNGIDTITTEKVDVPHWQRGLETATMLSPRKKDIAILGLGESIPTNFYKITADTIVVKSFAELDELPDSYVNGKIVVFNQPFVSYGETVVYRTQGATKAGKKGAVASLIRSITPFSLYTLHTGHQNYAPNVTKIPTASITVEDANLLERIYKKGERIIIQIEMENSFEMKTSRNVLVDLRGKDSPDKMVLVSGHIDSWDVGEGAMDDGGGMFISWFVPIILKNLGLTPKRTIRAALWTAEEVGLVGSRAYLNKHRNELNDINFILESDEGTFAPLGLDVGGSRRARCMMAEILKLFSPIDKIRDSEFPGSDMSQFVRAGVPGASLVNQNERYFYYHHTKADTMDVQNKTAVINCAAFWTAISYVIADLSVDVPRC